MAGHSRSPVLVAFVTFVTFVTCVSFAALASPARADRNLAIGEPTTHWARIIPPLGGPSPRTGATAIYHPGRDALIIYGGADPIYRGDVWQLPLAEGSAWVPLAPGGPVPQRRVMHSTIYNSRDDQSVIFGGFYDNFLSDMTVLSFSGQLWWFPNPGTGAPPPPRGGHTAVYDPVGQRMLVMGGYDGRLRDDVWEYTPPGVGAWRQLTVSGTGPSPRAQHAAVFDPVRNRMIVIGGDLGVFANDVWALNLAGTPTWEPLTLIGFGPSPRREHSAIYDPLGDRVIVYGGFDGTRKGDIWALSLGTEPTWTRLGTAGPAPAARFGHAAVYDASRRRMVIFGGNVGPGQLSGEVWALQLDDPTPVPQPAVLSLTGASPNPSAGEMEVAFSLAGAEPASLELFDLRGRRVAAREVGGLGSGEHRARLAEGRGLAAGVYLVRLRQHDRVLIAKVSVVR